MITYRLEIKNNIDVALWMQQYSYLFKKLYKHFDKLTDKDFERQMLDKYNLMDSWFYQTCKTEVQSKLDKHDIEIQDKKNKLNKLKELLKENKFEKKKTKYNVIKKVNYLEKYLKNNTNITFGGKELLRQITQFKQQGKIKKYKKLLNEYKNARILNICSIGEAPQTGNRKINFDLLNNRVVFKPDAKTKINIEFYCRSKKQIKTLEKLQKAIDNKQIPVSIQINNKYIYLMMNIELNRARRAIPDPPLLMSIKKLCLIKD